MSCFICIRDAPTYWNAGVVRGKFSQYGPIDDIAIEQSANSSFVIVEFECEDDAINAVEDNVNSEQRISLYNPTQGTGTTGSTIVVVNNANNSEPNIEASHCYNSNCTNQVIIDGYIGTLTLGSQPQKIYCSRECYSNMLDMKGRVDIYDKWIGSLGRSGTGALKDRSKLDKLIVTVDSEGMRRVDLDILDRSKV